jgi:4-alpha-glucanotransferase
MNTPGTAAGNWGWQAPRHAFDERLAGRLRSMLADANRLRRWS